jgi:hypothetical protein
MGFRWQDGGYSSEVELHLLVDGRRLEVAQVGKDFLILREPAAVPSGHAELIITIDGNEQVHHVILSANDPATAELEFA